MTTNAFEPDGFDSHSHSDIPLRLANTYIPNVLRDSPRRAGVVSKGEIGIGSQEGLIVRDTFFSRELITWVRNQHYGFDSEILDGMNEIVLSNIKKMTAIQMCLDDLGNSITELGLNINMDNYTKLLDELGAMLALNTLKQAADLLGLSEYRDEIVLREINKNFGTATWEASQARAEKSKADARSQEKRDHIVSMSKTLEEVLHKFRTAIRPQQHVTVNKHTKSEAKRDPEREHEESTQRLKSLIDEIVDPK